MARQKCLSAQHSTAQHSTAQHSTAQHSTAQHSTARHGTAQHSTAWHSTAHSKKADLPVQSAWALRGQRIGCQTDRKQHCQQTKVQGEDEHKEHVAGVGLLVRSLNPAQQPREPRWVLLPSGFALASGILISFLHSVCFFFSHRTCAFLMEFVFSLRRIRRHDQKRQNQCMLAEALATTCCRTVKGTRSLQVHMSHNFQWPSLSVIKSSRDSFSA